MLVDLTKRVWAARCHPKIRSWKFVLLNLCYHANTFGEAYPGIATIAQETGYTTRAVIDALAGLEELRIIKLKSHCGQRKRVAVYDLSALSTNVDNLANGEITSCLQLSNGEVSSKKGRLNGEVSSANGEVSSHRSILGRKLVSKSVCIGGNSELTSPFVDNSGKAGQNHPAEGSLPPHGAEPRQKGNDGDAARNEIQYIDLVKKVGWKPVTDQDRRYCMAHCYTLGANRAEAEKFIRYNAVRKWTVCVTGTVNDAAKEWVARWRESNPAEFVAERERRKRRDASRTLD